ncbi:hypothetical protein HB162lentus_01510 [Mammaliicoccus lentus]
MGYKRAIKENTDLNDKQINTLNNIINKIVTEFNKNNYNYNFAFHSIFLDWDNDISLKFLEEMESYGVTLFDEHLKVLNNGSSQQIGELINYMKIELS